MYEKYSSLLHTTHPLPSRELGEGVGYEVYTMLVGISFGGYRLEPHGCARYFLELRALPFFVGLRMGTISI